MKILLSDWAARRYQPAPSMFVLRKWCRDGEIHPQPEKVGREWYVDENARRLTSAEPVAGGLVRQLERA
ncbi:MAG: excisionase [Methylibium sp.]